MTRRLPSDREADELGHASGEWFVLGTVLSVFVASMVALAVLV